MKKTITKNDSDEEDEEYEGDDDKIDSADVDESNEEDEEDEEENSVEDENDASKDEATEDSQNPRKKRRRKPGKKAKDLWKVKEDSAEAIFLKENYFLNSVKLASKIILSTESMSHQYGYSDTNEPPKIKFDSEGASKYKYRLFESLRKVITRADELKKTSHE